MLLLFKCFDIKTVKLPGSSSVGSPSCGWPTKKKSTNSKFQSFKISNFSSEKRKRKIFNYLFVDKTKNTCASIHRYHRSQVSLVWLLKILVPHTHTLWDRMNKNEQIQKIMYEINVLKTNSLWAEETKFQKLKLLYLKLL